MTTPPLESLPALLDQLTERLDELPVFAEELVQLAMDTEDDVAGERLIHIAARLRFLPPTLIAAIREDTKTPDWQPGKWWRVTAPDGSLWAETSDEEDARSRMRPGDVLQRMYVLADSEWRTV